MLGSLGPLGRLGFNSLTDAVYRKLITSSAQRVESLAEQLGKPVADVEEALDQLEKLDLLRPQGDGLGQLVDPQLGLRALLLRQISGIEDRVKEFEEDRVAVLDLLDQFTDGHPGLTADGTHVAGRDAITERLRELAGTVEDEWLAFIPGGVTDVSWLGASWALELQVRRRGVPSRTVHTDSIRADARASSRATRCDQLGGPVRTVPSLPVHMILVDRALALLPVYPDDPWRRVMEISGPGVIVALTALFESVWESAVPLGTDTEPDEHGLSPQERELLRLLSRGLTDDAVRRRLGVSLRTVRRVVADLSARLGAESRFEIGYRAAKRGWI